MTVNVIHGLSEIRRMPRIGKVRLGIKEKSKSGKLYPKAVDYFVVQHDQSTSEAAADAFHDTYGEHPTALNIMFPTDDPQLFFAQSYRRYGSSAGLTCRGDGRAAMQLDQQTGELLGIACDPAMCQWHQAGHCRPIGSLQFLLPDVAGIGVWQIDTSSINSIINVNSGIDFVRRLTGGRIALLPLRLILRPREVQVAGRLKTIYVLDLAHEQLKLIDVLRAAKTPVEQLLLPPADTNMPDDLYPALINEPVEVTPSPDAPPPSETVTKQQRAMLEKAAQAAGVDPDEAAGYLRDEFGKASGAELTQAEFERMLAWLELRSGAGDAGEEVSNPPTTETDASAADAGVQGRLVEP